MVSSIFHNSNFQAEDFFYTFDPETQTHGFHETIYEQEEEELDELDELEDTQMEEAEHLDNRKREMGAKLALRLIDAVSLFIHQKNWWIYRECFILFHLIKADFFILLLTIYK